jgi:hypothetical protein
VADSDVIATRRARVIAALLERLEPVDNRARIRLRAIIAWAFGAGAATSSAMDMEAAPPDGIAWERDTLRWAIAAGMPVPEGQRLAVQMEQRDRERARDVLCDAFEAGVAARLGLRPRQKGGDDDGR